MPLSHSPYLRFAAGTFATISLGFGIKFCLNPQDAFTFFEFPTPILPADRKVAEGFIILYAIRDVFMAAAIYAGAYYNERRTLGWTLLAMGGVAFVDGVVCKMQIGKGEWNHWSYGPVAAVVGALLLGVLDRT